MAKRSATAAKPAPAKSSSKWSLPARSASAPTALEGQPVTEDDIRLRAYRNWEAAGRPDGDGVGFWLEAEQELRQGS